MEGGTSLHLNLKNQQRQHWDAVAEGWGAQLDWIDRNFSPLTRWLERAAGWAPGKRVLDVACGAGYPALAAAAAVRPGGSAVATDISENMLAVASRRAKAAGLDNVEFVQADAEELRLDGAPFDAVTNATGLMFCPEPQRAIAAAHRVLEPGGCLAVATWDEPSKNPFFALITSVAAGFLGLQPPDPDAPGPFRLASPDKLGALLSAAGFKDVRVESRPMTCECASVDEYCQIFSDVAWKARLARLSPDEHRRLKDAIAAAAKPYADADGRLRLVATPLCASGRK